ncbi:DUF4352 domain-containing protein [Nonomuraea candida]|uniref:DUF4352 domain-containing protein n=1 Tax=Nonomuraea candida TaxID=359159 RepID=UPI0006940939|nr:DUF4352 domain-containing protein [Nonomuraea candida]
MGYPPLPHGPYGPQQPQQHPYGHGGYPPQQGGYGPQQGYPSQQGGYGSQQGGYPPGHGPGHLSPDDLPPRSARDVNALVALLAVGVPLLLLGGVAALVMVLTDTGRSTVITEAGGPNMIMPSRDALPGDPPADAAGQGTDPGLAVQPPPAGGGNDQPAVGAVTPPGTTTTTGQQPPAQTGTGQPGTGQTGTGTGQTGTGQTGTGQTGTGQTGTGQTGTGQTETGQTGTGQGGTGQGGTGQGALTAAVGGSITLQGTDPGLKMSVTVNRLVNPATPASDLLKPKTGNKFAAVEITLANVGQAVYSEMPSIGAWLIDAEGQQYRSTIVHDVREGQSFGGTANINGGDSRKGVIVFEVPQAARPAKFQFALNSGIASQKGEWTLS